MYLVYFEKGQKDIEALFNKKNKINTINFDNI